MGLPRSASNSHPGVPGQQNENRNLQRRIKPGLHLKNIFLPQQRRRLLFLLIFAASAVMFFFLNTTFFEHGFASDKQLYLGEKSLLVYRGTIERLENTGFTNNPLALMLTAVFRNPFLTSALVGGTILTMMLLSLCAYRQQKVLSWPLFILLFSYLIFSPLTLFMLTQKISTAIVVALILLIYHHLFCYDRSGLSYNLFMFGILSACVFLTQFQAIFIFPLFSIALVAKHIGKEPMKSSAVILAGLFPVFFMLAGSCYLNWIFLEDPWHFFTHGITLDVPLSAQTPTTVPYDFHMALTMSLDQLREHILLLPPYILVGVALLILYRTTSCVSLIIFLSPLFLLFSELLCNVTRIPHAFVILFPATAVAIYVHCQQQLNRPLFRRLFTISLAVSLAASFILPLQHKGTEEHTFTRILLDGKHHGELDTYRQLLASINDDGMILMDDTVNYPLVYLSQNPRQFYLPYQYEFNMVLIAPQHFVRYLVVSSQPARDQVLGRFPLAAIGYVPGFTLVGRFGELSLYKVLHSPPATPDVTREANEKKITGLLSPALSADYLKKDG